VKVSEEQLSVCEREHKVQQDWFEYARLTAPYDGKVTHRYVHTGHFVQPANSGTTSKVSEPLFVVMRTDAMRIVVQVPESDAPLIRDGANATVRIPSLRDQELPCSVTRSSWSLDLESRTLRVEIELDTDWFKITEQALAELQAAKVPDAVLAKLKPLQEKALEKTEFVKELDKLLNANEMKNYRELIVKTAAFLSLQPGLYVNVSIGADIPNVLTLPVEAILTDGDKNYCFVFEDGIAKRANVKVGMQNERYIQLISKQLPPSKDGTEGAWANFTGNEKVIISQLTTVKDGQAVTVK
jgi:multidrug efflux pump subunit AcrA (membrane-fusion protein)